MKSIYKLLAALFATALLFLAGCSSDDEEYSATGLNSVGSLSDVDVKACFDAVNSFRTGSEAFYISADNSTKTFLVGQLSALAFDEKLAQAAKIRAEEISSSFAHTRPDGTSCFTVLKQIGAAYGTCGENIAAGYRTGSAVFAGWKEDNKDYSGQGHRRNMLGKNFTKIGIAYFDKKGSTYGRYWVMELSN
ncbi:MAG: CAP domain-containing protein [Treponema sp.]|nr:CAP domain-containing protein [Candidatus Treponema equifaecale]